MRGPIPYLLLCGGLCLAVASGARHGDAWTTQRTQVSLVRQYEAVLAIPPAEVAAREEAEAGLRAADLLGPASDATAMAQAARQLFVGPQAAEGIARLQGAGLLHRDTPIAQARGEAKIKLESYQRRIDTLSPEEAARLPILGAAAGDDPVTSEEAVRALWAVGELNPPPGPADALALLGHPTHGARALAALSPLLPPSDSVEARLAAAKAELGPLGPSARLSAWWAAAGPGWALGVGLVALGALLARRGMVAAQSATSSLQTEDFPTAVAGLLAELAPLRLRLARATGDDTAPEVREALDRLQDERIRPLVEARGALIHQHGVGAFSEYFGPFSAAERQLNRAWSALTDGQPGHADAALASAGTSFEQALRAWDRVTSPDGAAPSARS